MNNENNQSDENIELINAPESQDLLNSVEDENLITAGPVVEHIDSQISMAPQSFDMVRPVTVNVVSDKADEVVEQVAGDVAVNSFNDVDLNQVQDQQPEVVQPIPVVETVNNVPVVVEPCSPKKSVIKTLIISILVLILIAAAAVGGYLWRDKTANDLNNQQLTEINSLTSSKAELTNKVSDMEADSFTKPVSTVVENIKSSITSKNTAALEGYMASSVIAIDGSSFHSTGDTTAAQVVVRVTNFIKDATTPWDFDLTDMIKESYTKLDYKMSNNLIIGKSANGKVVSFSFDSKGKISSVLLSSSDTLLK